MENIKKKVLKDALTLKLKKEVNYPKKNYIYNLFII